MTTRSDAVRRGVMLAIVLVSYTMIVLDISIVIDEINPPGVTINRADNGWTQPALEPALRRR